MLERLRIITYGINVLGVVPNNICLCLSAFSPAHTPIEMAPGVRGGTNNL